MKVIRFADKNWRPNEATLISTGDYRIPEDMSLELAERAVRDGAAVVVEPAQTLATNLALPAGGKRKKAVVSS
jgi:hypothetical protein